LDLDFFQKTHGGEKKRCLNNMRKPKKVYDDEFKETIRELYNTGKDVNMLSEEYGLPKSTIRQWVVYDLKKESNPMSAEALEIKALKKQMQDMKEENEILKKALTIFAQK
jgi:transposase